MRFIHACKYNYILWWYVYVQISIQGWWAGEKGPLLPALPISPGQMPKVAEPNPSHAPSSLKQGNRFEWRDARKWELQEVLQINANKMVWMQLGTAGWLQRRRTLMPTAIGITIPETSRTEAAAAHFSEAKAYFTAETWGWDTVLMNLPVFTSI